MSLQEEINQLDKEITSMAGQVEENLTYAIKACFEYEEGRSYEPVADYKVNAFERQAEQKCLWILFKERLFASDMRKVTGIMTMVEDLERLGDHAQDILEFALKLKNRKEDKNPINPLMKKLSGFVLKMVEDAIDSYIKRDLNLASHVISDDDEADKEYANLIDAIIFSLQKKEIEPLFAIYATLIVKYLERIGDHATNIAEWVIYINTGFYKDSQLV